MRRVGVPGGDACDGSFHRGGYSEDSRGEWRTGREVGPSSPNFTPLVSCKESPGGPRGVSMRGDVGLFLWLPAGLFSSQAKHTESGAPRGSGVHRWRRGYIFFVSSVGTRSLKLLWAAGVASFLTSSGASDGTVGR